MPEVNPEILQWARETAGLSPAEAASKVQLRDTRKGAALERLAALESGVESPSRPMLVRMAKAYRRPLLTFYLAEPPRRGDRGEDFRSLPFEPPEDEEAHLDALLRRIRARQRLVRAVLEDEEEAEPLSFIGSARIRDGIAAVVESIRSTLGIELSEFRAQGTADEAFRMIRGRVEEAGVFVLLIGDLGSHHTSLDVDVFRGFALADEVAPFVVINDRDSRAAWTFTLLHELAHLWLGRTGVSGGVPATRVERFCNDVASRFLVSPREVSLVARDIARGSAPREEVLAAYARDWKVSRTLLAYRLYRDEHLSHEGWRKLHERFREEWEESRAKARRQSRDRDGGPTYYTVRRHRLGPALIDLTGRMLAAGALTTTRASRILGVRPTQVGRLVEGHSASARPR